MQDTATQAMTEVALGLSMAFFALLILALISVSLPKNNVGSTNSSDLTIPIEQQINVQNETQQSDLKKTSASYNVQEQMIILHWDGEYFDINRKKFDVQAIDSNKEVIVAVSASSTLQELLTIQGAFAQYDIKLTTLSKEWEQSLSTGDSL